MPNPITRESLTMGLEDRYKKSHVGGAFDAKSIHTTVGDVVPTDPSNGSGVADSTFRQGGFVVRQNTTGFKDVDSTTSKELSVLLKGFSNKRYKS